MVGIKLEAYANLRVRDYVSKNKTGNLEITPVKTKLAPRRHKSKFLGAIHVLDRSLYAEEFLGELLKIAYAEPIEFVFDAISTRETQVLGYETLANTYYEGGFVSVKPHSAPWIADRTKEDDGNFKRVARAIGDHNTPQLRREICCRVMEWLAKGLIVIPEPG